MKKITLCLLALCLMLSFAACGSSNSPVPTEIQTEETQAAEARQTFTGTLEDKKDFMIVVTGEDGTAYSFNLDGVACPGEVGQTVTVTYTGDITDFDAQLMAQKVELVQN